LLLDTERAHEKIVLLNIAGDSSKFVRINMRAIQVSLTEDFEFSSVAESETIEQRRFAGSTRTCEFI